VRSRFLTPLASALVCAVITACDDPTAPRLVPSDGGIFAARATSSPSLTPTAASDARISLTWVDGETNETGWEVHRSSTGGSGTFDRIAALDANVTAHVDDGLSAGAEYCYKVRPYRSTKGKTTYLAFSAAACSTTFALPAPSNVAAAPGESSQAPWVSVIAVVWTDESSSEEGFRIERAGAVTGPWVIVATLASNVNPYRDAAIQLEQLTCYRVRAFKTGGESAPSSPACTAVPRSPGNVVARSLDAGSISVTWSDDSRTEDGYQVARSFADGVSSVVADLPANATTYRDTSVTPGVRYWYGVRARRDGGFSLNTASGSAVATSSPPLAPTNLTGLPWESYAEQRAYVFLQWTPQSSNQEGFRLERSADGGGWELLYMLSHTGGSFPAAKEQLFCYRVIAFNRLGDSPPSNVVCTAPPAAATNLTATATADFSAIDLTWQDNSAIEHGYQVQVRSCDLATEECWYTTKATVPANATSYRDQVPAGESVTYVVVAERDGGTSGPSNEATAWTAPPPAAPTNVTATAVSATRVDLSWSGTGDYFFVERCTGTAAICTDADYAGIEYVSGDSVSDPWVKASTTYTYRVYVFRSEQRSRPSAPVTVTTPP
jgi:hypothetical protein